MTDTQLLAGSLSNDLFRVSSLAYRGSNRAAVRFLLEAKKWAAQLQEKKPADYIQTIINEVLSKSDDHLTEEEAERFLMHGILVQNYALHQGKNK